MKKADISSYGSFSGSVGKTSCGAVYPLSVTGMYQCGDIFTEDDSLLIWHRCGFAFIFGSCGSGFLDSVYERFLNPRQRLPRRFVLFVQDPSAEEYFRRKQGLLFGRRYFFEYQGKPAASGRPLPEGFGMSELTEELIGTVEGHITPLFSWDSTSHFLEKGKGFCVVHNGKPAAWAFSAAVSDYETDIGVETLPDYRHMGLASAAAEKIAEYCIRSGRRPVWACDAQNTASVKLAEKTGFVLASECTTIRAQ